MSAFRFARTFLVHTGRILLACLPYLLKIHWLYLSFLSNIKQKATSFNFSIQKTYLMYYIGFVFLMFLNSTHGTENIMPSHNWSKTFYCLRKTIIFLGMGIWLSCHLEVTLSYLSPETFYLSNLSKNYNPVIKI